MEKIWTYTSEKMPDTEGEYLVVVIIDEATNHTFKDMCFYNPKKKKFTYWDHYDDTEKSYSKKDIKAWFKIPECK